MPPVIKPLDLVEVAEGQTFKVFDIGPKLNEVIEQTNRNTVAIHTIAWFLYQTPGVWGKQDAQAIQDILEGKE